MAIRCIAVLAAIAAVLSLYLTITSMFGSQPLGCGGGLLDCESVLATRWSTWLGQPVSAAGFAIYATLAGLAMGSLFELPDRVKILVRAMLLGITAIASVSAVWFIVLKAAVLGKFCLYCSAIHGCGLAIAAIVAAGLMVSVRELAGAMTVGLLAGAIIIGGQVSDLNKLPTKPTYAVVVDPDLMVAEPIIMPWPEESTAAEGDHYAFLNDQLRVARGSRPVLGDPNAPQVTIKLFDYTCGYCRRLHGQIDDVLAEHPGQFCFVLIHIPLAPACNPYADDDQGRHAAACELSRLALAVWIAEPEKFAGFNRWLCAGDEARSAAGARSEATRLIGEEQLEVALVDPIIDQILTENVELYALEEIPLLPSLFTERRIISGSFVDADELNDVLSGE